MKSILAELRCPQCGFQTHKKSEQLIVTDFEPKSREAILNHQFFHHQCPRCHHNIIFLHPCLYQDGKCKFMILLQSQMPEELPEVEENLAMRKRIVSYPEELEEKIHIFEDGLNDILIEWMKRQLSERLHLSIPSLRYHDFDLASDTLWFQVNQDELDLKGIQKSYYDNLKNRYQIDENEKKFKVINHETIDSFMKFVK